MGGGIKQEKKTQDNTRQDNTYEGKREREIERHKRRRQDNVND